MKKIKLSTQTKTNNKILLKKRIRKIKKENNVLKNQQKQAEEQKVLNKELFTMFDQSEVNEIDYYEDLFTLSKIDDIKQGLLCLNVEKTEKTKCSSCNIVTMKREPFCKSCGYKQDYMIQCVACLYKILPTDKFCMMCGQEQRLIKVCSSCKTKNIFIREECFQCNETLLNSNDN